MHKFFAFGTALLLVFSGCIWPQPPKESGKYFEIVYQNPACASGTCFDEKIVLETGFVFEKQQNYGDNYKVSFCSANKEKLAELFSFLGSNLLQNRLVECSACASYHLFYNSGNATLYSSLPVENQTIEQAVFEKSQGICGQQESAEFLHAIFGKGKEYLDYHVFSKGTIVFERFGLKEGELLESKVSSITEKEFSELKALFSEAFFSEQAQNNCPANNYFYGFVEAVVEGKYAYTFNCGGSSAAGNAFNGLAKRLLG